MRRLFPSAAVIGVPPADAGNLVGQHKFIFRLALGSREHYRGKGRGRRNQKGQSKINTGLQTNISTDFSHNSGKSSEASYANGCHIRKMQKVKCIMHT
jgi:hypothetical protein